MRPDNYLRIVEAYYYNEQKSWLPWRKLYTILFNSFGESEVQESSVLFLPFIDCEEQKKSAPAGKIFTKEEVEELKRRYGVE